MKKRAALLLALIMVFTLASSVFAKAADDAAGLEIKQKAWENVATDSFAAEDFEADYSESVDLEMHVMDLEAGEPLWDGTLETVYSFTLEWETTPGTYSRTADSYSWDNKTLTYTREESGAWQTNAKPTLSLKLTNRSNTAVLMRPVFKPIENVAAYMELAADSVLIANSAVPLIRDTDMAPEMTGDEDNDGTAGDAAGNSFTEREGKATSAQCSMSFTVLTGFGNIKDSIGTVTVSFETAENRLNYTVENLLT